MKVYVVQMYDYEESYAIAAFTTKEKAEKAIEGFEAEDRKNNNTDWQYCFSEMELQ